VVAFGDSHLLKHDCPRLLRAEPSAAPDVDGGLDRAVEEGEMALHQVRADEDVGARKLRTYTPDERPH
jgi:hypothetical protein